MLQTGRLIHRLQSRRGQLLYRVQLSPVTICHSRPRALSSTSAVDDDTATTSTSIPIINPFTPTVDPELLITCDPLPPDIQRAVDEHTHAIWQPEAQKKTTLKRNMFRHWHLDSRKHLTKHKKRQLRTEFEITPFVILGAHRALVNRLQARTGDTDATAQSILNEKIPFQWFETGATAVGNHQGLALPEKKSDVARLMIVHELMAMTMRPVLAPYLPAHAWCLQDDPHEVSPLDKVQSVASNVEYDTSRHCFMIWDLRAKDGTDLVLETKQFKSMLNVVGPYVSYWWPELLNKIFNWHGDGSRKLRKWKLSDDSYSSLPAVLTDLLFLRLDVLIADREPTLQAKLRSRLKKLESKVNPDEERVTEYHRVGPVVLVTFQGPEKLREKHFRSILFHLKSSFHLKLKENKTDEWFTLVHPYERKKAQTKKAKKVSKSKLPPSASNSKKRKVAAQSVPPPKLPPPAASQKQKGAQMIK